MDQDSQAKTEPTTPGLPPNAIDIVTLEARKEGVFAGLTGGLASAVLGQRLLGFSRNKTIFCGVLTGILSGYFFTEAFKTAHIAQLHAEEARLRARTNETPNSEPHST